MSNMDQFQKIFEQVQKAQESFSKIKDEANAKIVEASAGGGMVKVKASGAMELIEVKIDPTVVNADDVEMLEDLVKAAVNESLRQAKDIMKGELTKLTGGFPIPGL